MKRILYIFILAMGIAACGKDNPQPGPGPAPKPVGDATVSGKVKGSDGKAIAGVVVSDGLHCVVTDADGCYELPADLATARFVFVSTPSKYSAPVENGLPVFYRRLSEITPVGGVCKNVDFTLNRISNPSRCTILVTADPQPRPSTAGYDKIGYHSLDCCKDMYRDLKETRAAITDRPVYGISLGDITHENASLYNDYRTGLSTTGFATYNVIGNHDHTYSSEDCEDDFENVFGPCNYSFNLGGIHFVVLDDMIMTMDEASGLNKKVNDGLTEDIWEWLKNDLSFVPKDTPLMVCAHSPIVRHNNSVRNGLHYADCRSLFHQYEKVYQWAGHVHSSYNYVDTKDPVVEAHSVTRTTGALWTNEYIGGNGTPRGYVVIDVDGTDVSWKFKPIFYQTGTFAGGAKQPSYEYRDWNYDSKGVAVMKEGGKPLGDDYQMHVYKPGTYGDSYVYVNVFLWDELWKTPVFTVDGVPATMTRITSAQKTYLYDASDKEMSSWYKANNSTLGGNADFSASPSQCYSMFRAYVNSEHGSGKVSVEDRFGNTYTSSINW